TRHDGFYLFLVTHNISGFLTYALPFGRNRTYGKNWNRAVDAIAGGWQVISLAAFHSGFPLTINAVDASGTKSRGPRANCIAPPVVFGTRNVPAALGGGYQWFSPASYAQPTSGFGSCGVATVRRPTLNTLHLTINKIFTLT